MQDQIDSRVDGHYGKGTVPYYDERMRQKSINLPAYMHKAINDLGGSAYMRALIDTDLEMRGIKAAYIQSAQDEQPLKKVGV